MQKVGKEWRKHLGRIYTAARTLKPDKKRKGARRSSRRGKQRGGEVGEEGNSSNEHEPVSSIFPKQDRKRGGQLRKTFPPFCGHGVRVTESRGKRYKWMGTSPPPPQKKNKKPENRVTSHKRTSRTQGGKKGSYWYYGGGGGKIGT